MNSVVALRNFIGGSWVAGSGPEFTSVSPHDPRSVVGAGRHASKAEVDAAVGHARAAAADWRRTPIHTRAECLLRAADVIDSHQAKWGRELAREEGKPLTEARGEVGRAAQVLRFHAHRADAETGEIFASPRQGEKILVERRPVGVVAAITPFNFPIAIPAWKIAPALVYGNAVVWKPPTMVPLLAVRLAEALQQAGLPAGVLSLVHGDAEVGRWLIEHDGIDAVTFTGSTAVGRSIAGACASRGIAVQAGMGGKNAAVVLPDADIAAAVADVVSGAFRSAGQKCTATSRLVLHADIAEGFLAQLRDAVATLPVGDPEEPANYVGPVVSAAARHRIDTALVTASTNGAQIVAQSAVRPELRGHYVAPTVVQIDEPAGPLWHDELFGPVLTVAVVGDTDTALRAAAAGPYALSVSVFTADLGTVMTAIDELDAGMIHINSETAGADPHVPFGGNGASGYGPREQGAAARDFFTTAQTIYVKALSP